MVPCKKCPPATKMTTQWLTCANPQCNALYRDYDGLFHSQYCPKCAERRLAAQRQQTAAGGRFATMRTNQPGVRDG